MLIKIKPIQYRIEGGFLFRYGNEQQLSVFFKKIIAYTALVDPGDEMFKGTVHSIAMSIIRPLIYLRENHQESLDEKVFCKHFSLYSLCRLDEDVRLPKDIVRGLLNDLPGYRGEASNELTEDQERIANGRLGYCSSLLNIFNKNVPT